MVAVAVLAATSASANPQTSIMNFEALTPSTDWVTVNDDVMGGISSSSWKVADGTAVFAGDLSLENNGGFASVRSRQVDMDFSAAEGIALRVRGDGRRYKLTLRTAERFDSPLYQAPFETTDGEWQEHRLLWKDFVPSFRGRVLQGEPPVDPAQLKAMGILVSDKQEGTFRLEVDWIKPTKAQSQNDPGSAD
jgi:monofunctional biosynthetic peptidoglycan transglycosylase